MNPPFGTPGTPEKNAPNESPIRDAEIVPPGTWTSSLGALRGINPPFRTDAVKHRCTPWATPTHPTLVGNQ